MKLPIITLLTDFGYRDHYVASMKGVILSIAPETIIVDISHGVPKQDILAAAYVLKSSYRYFPPGTIHVAVVDPGVGTNRRSIVLKTRNYVFVGPDNGVLALSAFEDGIEEARLIENRNLFRPDVSYTFHGRDIYAPVAAHIARGVPLSAVGPILEEEIHTPVFMEPQVRHGFMECKVFYVDDFGNVVLNATKRHLEAAGFKYGMSCSVTLKNQQTLAVRLLQSYGYSSEGEPLLLINSEGYLELAVNKGDAAKRFELAPNDSITVRLNSL
ncbi:MAG: S-adenosyl-l-methionine hydroxide adenosyltransferase family protein [Thermofilaceae archaeon]|nr:S-adenosyl-l-methionine hydroxide adenosyltransferase family protein [Thermofilaceae archaeon]MDW8003707.1 SAM-dependent chlorinase/fluorinase [Thermofilaceae archaeon]